MRLFRPLVVVLFGLALVVLGLIYAVVFVNIPFPDPTPEQAAQQRLHDLVSTTMMLSGIAIFGGGSVWALARRSVRPR
jgi:hypothetical protein